MSKKKKNQNHVINQPLIPCAGENVAKQTLSYIAGESESWWSAWGEQCLSKTKHYIRFEKDYLLLGGYLRNSHTCGRRDMFKCVHYNSGEKSKCPSSVPSFLCYLSTTEIVQIMEIQAGRDTQWPWRQGAYLPVRCQINSQQMHKQICITMSKSE